MGDCWVDLFEATNFCGKLRRISGPGVYPRLRGAASGVRVESAITGPSAYAFFYRSDDPENGVWLVAGASIARLEELGVTDEMESVRILNRAPQPHEMGYGAYERMKRIQ